MNKGQYSKVLIRSSGEAGLFSEGRIYGAETRRIEWKIKLPECERRRVGELPLASAYVLRRV